MDSINRAFKKVLIEMGLSIIVILIIVNVIDIFY